MIEDRNGVVMSERKKLEGQVKVKRPGYLRRPALRGPNLPEKNKREKKKKHKISQTGS